MVVYVEDNARHQQTLKRLLQKRNIDLLVWDNAEEAYQGIKETQPDLVFLDIQLANGSSGLDLARRLRCDGYQIPIVLVSSFRMQGDPYWAKANGYAGYLTKPLHQHNVFAVLDQFATTPRSAA